jgi:hypothetical protein
MLQVLVLLVAAAKILVVKVDASIDSTCLPSWPAYLFGIITKIL